jgi:putative ABC transport system substrate-binding protein
MWSEIQRAGRALSVTPLAWEARGPDDIDRVFSAIGTERIVPFIILPHRSAFLNRRQIVGSRPSTGCPPSNAYREFAEAGFLMSYGPRMAGLWRRAAAFADKILKGAKPVDLFVDQPTNFELVITLKIAKAVGLAIPPSLLQQALRRQAAPATRTDERGARDSHRSAG